MKRPFYFYHFFFVDFTLSRKRRSAAEPGVDLSTFKRHRAAEQPGHRWPKSQLSMADQRCIFTNYSFTSSLRMGASVFLINSVTRIIADGKKKSDKEVAIDILRFLQNGEAPVYLSSMRNELLRLMGGKMYKAESFAYKLGPTLSIEPEAIIKYIRGDDHALPVKQIALLVEFIEKKTSVL